MVETNFYKLDIGTADWQLKNSIHTVNMTSIAPDIYLKWDALTLNIAL